MNQLNENIELLAKQSFETATVVRRFLSFLLDMLIVIAISYLLIVVFSIFKEIDHFFEVFEASKEDIENIELFNQMRNLLAEVLIKVYLILIGSKLFYFTFIPALLGNGRTVGKFLAGIGVVDKETLNEISPSRLMLREFVGRILIETVFIVPYIISAIISFFREDSRCLHDLIAGTVVIRLDMYEATEY